MTKPTIADLTDDQAASLRVEVQTGLEMLAKMDAEDAADG